MTLAPIPPQRLSSSTWRLGSYHIPCYLVRGQKAGALFEAGISATGPLVPAQLDDLGGVCLSLLPAEGHAPHGLLGLVPEERVAFASDSAGYGTDRGPAYPMCFVSFQAYLDTMRHLTELEPEVLGLGHQLCLMGRQEGPYLEQTARRMAADREEIRQGCGQGAEPEQLAQRLFEKYYRHELTMFPPKSALAGCRLLVRRCLED